MQASSNSLESILISSGLLKEDHVNKIRIEMAQQGKNFDEIVESLGLLSENQLTEARAKSLGVPLFSNGNPGISPEALNLIPKSLAERFNFFPLSVDRQNKILSIVMSDPTNLSGIEFLERRFQMKVEVSMGTKSLVNKLINEKYSQGLSGDVTVALKRRPVVEGDGDRVMISPDEAQLIRQPAVVKIVNQILGHAIRLRASDIHIEPGEERTRVRYRIDGILQEKLELPHDIHPAVISRIKILSGMKIDERRLPQDGRFNFETSEGSVDLRVSSLPTVYGEKIVMRLLKKGSKVPTLEELGLRGRALKFLREAIAVPHGIILATGPTGSGKTTTLYSALAVVSKPSVNIITLEDPVEYKMTGINQVQVNPTAGLTFASGLRSFLRQDPDIIMVGEIRDEETTDLAIQAALTGHLVFSTIHTNSAAGAIPRLIDLKAEPFLLVSSLTAIIGQRVVRKICDECKESYVPPASVVEPIKKELGPLFESWKQSNPAVASQAAKAGGEILLYRGKGCSSCDGTGYKGRIGIYEVLTINQTIAKLIAERASSDKIQAQAVSEGMLTMKHDGYLRVLDGVTSLEEVLRVAQDQLE
jgi:type IV pilus assembly protein PilB